MLDNDSDVDLDPLQAALVGDVSNGTLNLNTDGSFSYTSAPDYAGTDSFTYTAGDSVNQSGNVTVTIGVGVDLTATITAPALFNSSSISVDVQFSETILGFDGADLVLTNATLSDFIGSGSSYSFVLTPLVQGSVQVSIPEDAGHSQVGIGNLDSLGQSQRSALRHRRLRGARAFDEPGDACRRSATLTATNKTGPSRLALPA